MKKIIAIVLLALCLCGCDCSPSDCSPNPVEYENEKNTPSMFTVIEDSYFWRVVYHNDTKVMYTVSCGSSNFGNFTLLVNPDGTPMLWEAANE